MDFETPLVFGTLLRRYKRFIADVRLADGTVVSAHCPNTGSMISCNEPGWRVGLTRADRPSRRLKFTWELVHNGRCWIGVNTGLANKVALEGIRSGGIPELSGYPQIETERPYGVNSRIDILLRHDAGSCYVEVKSVTLVGEDGRYCFPDSVTERGRKHLVELTRCVAAGHRAVMLYIVQRSDGTSFRPAHEIDPAYAQALGAAVRAGVEVLSYRADVSVTGVRLAGPVTPVLH